MPTESAGGARGGRAGGNGAAGVVADEQQRRRCIFVDEAEGRRILGPEKRRGFAGAYPCIAITAAGSGSAAVGGSDRNWCAGGSAGSDGSASFRRGQERSPCRQRRRRDGSRAPDRGSSGCRDGSQARCLWRSRPIPDISPACPACEASPHRRYRLRPSPAPGRHLAGGRNGWRCPPCSPVLQPSLLHRSLSG